MIEYFEEKKLKLKKITSGESDFSIFLTSSKKFILKKIKLN
jgi:hypothetical protein